MHSRYTRLVQDLPRQGIPVRMRLHTRRYFCDHPDCTRQISTERLPGVVASYARRTNRPSDWVTYIAFALSGESGARLLRKLGTFLSGDSLLSHIRPHQVGVPPSPRVLSVDDFALWRDQNYGTILVDLECHHVVDLLPDRTASALSSCLTEHPGVEIVCWVRDGHIATGRLANPIPSTSRLSLVSPRCIEKHTNILWRSDTESSELVQVGVPFLGNGVKGEGPESDLRGTRPTIYDWEHPPPMTGASRTVTPHRG